MRLCECSKLDWSGCDMTAEHHPDCTQTVSQLGRLSKLRGKRLGVESTLGIPTDRDYYLVPGTTIQTIDGPATILQGEASYMQFCPHCQKGAVRLGTGQAHYKLPRYCPFCGKTMGND